MAGGWRLSRIHRGVSWGCILPRPLEVLILETSPSLFEVLGSAALVRAIHAMFVGRGCRCRSAACLPFGTAPLRQQSANPGRDPRLLFPSQDSVLLLIYRWKNSSNVLLVPEARTRGAARELSRPAAGILRIRRLSRELRFSLMNTLKLEMGPLV